KLMLGSTKAANEQIEKFAHLINELDASKDPGAKVGPGGKVISSIFDLDLLREKKYLLQDWVKKHNEQKTIQTKEKHTVSA
ncbi:MAG: hypothetical protein QG563_217, partial [Patescibacteria group bacterium]|nr:hypothetical protein [Patescibacteria group bacterium]